MMPAGFGKKNNPEPESDSDWDSITEQHEQDHDASRLNESLASLADLQPNLSKDESLGTLKINIDSDEESIHSVIKGKPEEKKKPFASLIKKSSPTEGKNNKIKKTDSKRNKRKSSPPRVNEPNIKDVRGSVVESRNVKNEFPPNLQSAITDDDPPSIHEHVRPSGVSRKGSLYDPEPSPSSLKDKTIPDKLSEKVQLEKYNPSRRGNGDDNRNIFYFNHPTPDYVVSESRHNVFMERIADKAEDIFVRIFREFFGGLRIVISFFIILIVELWRFLVLAIFRPVILGIIVSIGENLTKPLLAGLFNGIINPLLVLLHNICYGIKTSLAPIVNCFVVAVTTILKSFRLCEINRRPDDKELTITV